MVADDAAPILQLQRVSKRFGVVQALDDVTIDVHAGEVLALMGENGAGKSTLLHIIAGDYQPTDGHIRLEGSEISFRSPRNARDRGVRVVNQEAEIVGGVSVLENIFLGDLPVRRRIVRRSELRSEGQKLLGDLGFSSQLDLDMLGEDLSPAQRQMVEIVRAIRGDVRVVAFDEPTSSLASEESELLFSLIAKLRGRGVAVIYVSHRMKEILRLGDRVAVLRDGRLVGEMNADETSESAIVQMMVGRELGDLFAHTSHTTSEERLRVEGLTSSHHASGVSFSVHAGEVVGFAGLIGAGRSELARTIVGDIPRTSGEIFIDGAKAEINHPADAIDAGIGLAPEDRKTEALVMIRSVLENTSLAALRSLTTARIIRRKEERSAVSTFTNQLRVRTPSIDQEVGKLSGGNMQKVVLARWLLVGPKILILDEPTRGIDVGAKSEIYRLIDDLAATGIAIMLISSDLPEVLGMSDRILVMQDGRITGELIASQADEESVLRLAMADDLEQISELEHS